MILSSLILGHGEENIIILHALYACKEQYIKLAKPLEDKYKIHILDLRNHGSSPHYNTNSYEDMMEDLIIYMKANNIIKSNFFGHSIGGKLAMQLAHKYPDIIIKVIILDISPQSYCMVNKYSDIAIKHLNIACALQQLDINEYKTYKEIKDNLLNIDESYINVILKNIKRHNKTFKWIINIDTISQYIPQLLNGFYIDNFTDNKIITPILFIKCSNSNYMLSDDRKFINFIFSNSQFIELEDCGHILTNKHFEILPKIINNFINT